MLQSMHTLNFLPRMYPAGFVSPPEAAFWETLQNRDMSGKPAQGEKLYTLTVCVLVSEESERDLKLVKTLPRRDRPWQVTPNHQSQDF